MQTFDTFWIAQQLGYLKITPGPGNVPAAGFIFPNEPEAQKTDVTVPPSTSGPILTSTMDTLSSAGAGTASTVAPGQRLHSILSFIKDSLIPNLFSEEQLSLIH